MYKKAISMAAISGMLIFALPGLTLAQSTSANHRTMHKHISITGCLTKGNEAGEYNMKANGKLYGLTSTTVKLVDHVGHEVMVRGYITPESQEGAEANEKNNSEAGETGGDIDVTVTSLKMIGTTCKM